MIYKVSYLVEYDRKRREPKFSDKLFTNKKEALKFMVDQKDNFPVLYMYTERAWKSIFKECD